MSFDPLKLLENVHHKVRGPKPKVSIPSKGKKRAKDIALNKIPSRFRQSL